MIEKQSFMFSRAIVRQPSSTIINGLRDGTGPNPDAARFLEQHAAYVSTLKDAGAKVTQLPALEAFPDSVFVEDTCICLKEAAIVLRPGAPSRFGESEKIRPTLEKLFSRVIDLPGVGFIDGGDVLLTDAHVFIGLSARTNLAGLEALSSVLAPFGYTSIRVNPPADILHFKTECGLLDSNTIFATATLAATGCFDAYSVIEAPKGEEAAANIVRYNDVVLLSAGFPNSEMILREHGFKVVVIDTSEAALVDGGLSCMSLRF